MLRCRSLFIINRTAQPWHAVPTAQTPGHVTQPERTAREAFTVGTGEGKEGAGLWGRRGGALVEKGRGFGAGGQEAEEEEEEDTEKQTKALALVYTGDGAACLYLTQPLLHLPTHPISWLLYSFIHCLFDTDGYIHNSYGTSFHWATLSTPGGCTGGKQRKIGQENST